MSDRADPGAGSERRPAPAPEGSTPSGWVAGRYPAIARFVRALGAGRGSKLLELQGVTASVSRGTPGNSLFNSVVYESPAELRDSIDELKEAYKRAGVHAWTVWVPVADSQTATLLAERGHRLDSEPHSMSLELSEVPEPDQPLELERGVDWETVWRINDSAYGLPDGTWAAGLGRKPDRGLHSYGAFHEGWVASVLASLDDGDDCGIYAVATLPEARGNRLATRLVHEALWDAAKRGRRTASLQAAPAAYPIYRRLGFADHGVVGLWEHRVHPP